MRWSWVRMRVQWRTVVLAVMSLGFSCETVSYACLLVVCVVSYCSSYQIIPFCLFRFETNYDIEEPSTLPAHVWALSNSMQHGLLETLMFAQAVKKFLRVLSTLRVFFTAFTRAFHWFLFWAILHTSYHISVNPILTLQSLLVTWCTNSLTFNNCTLCPHCIYVFCIYLRTNSDLCHLQHKLIGFYNRDEKCLQRGTD